MYNHDRNGDGKCDWQDGFIDYKLSSSGGSSSNPRRGSGEFRLPTWLMVVILLAVATGDLPINVFTILLSIALIAAICIRILS